MLLVERVYFDGKHDLKNELLKSKNKPFGFEEERLIINLVVQTWLK